MVKLNHLGQQVINFGQLGWKLVGFSLGPQGNSNDSASFVDVDGFSNVMIGGTVSITSAAQSLFAVAQFDLDGNLDSEFQSDGRAVLLLPGELNHFVTAGRFAPDQDLVLAGQHLPNGQADRDSFVMRLIGSSLELFSDGFESGSTSAW